jgi:hypothetical protein
LIGQTDMFSYGAGLWQYDRPEWGQRGADAQI